MLSYSILATAAVATAGHVARQADDDGYVWSRNEVLGVPETVEAGEETIFRFNFTDQRSTRTVFEEMEYTKVQVFLSRYLDKEEGQAQVYCKLFHPVSAAEAICS